MSGGEGRTLDRRRVPDVGSPEPLDPPRAERFRLSNGLRVVLVERRSLPLVAVEMVIRGGSSTLPPERAGLSAFAADMLDEGTERRSAVQIARTFDGLGARFKSASGWDAAFVEFDVLSSRVEATLELVGELLHGSTFPGHELERIRRERLNRVLQRRDRPRALADDALARVLYGAGHPYGHPVLGDRNSLEAITRDDVVTYVQRHYHAGNATLVIVGDVTRRRLEPVLERTLGAWPGGAPVPLPEPGTPDRNGRVVHLVDRPGASQSQVRVGRIAAARTSRDYFPLTVLNTVLGGSFTSRLNTRLREEKGFTYGAGSVFAMRRWPGPFVASSSVHTPVTHEAVEAFVSEIRRIRDEPVPAPELERARRYVAYRLPQRFEGVQDVASRYGEQVLYDLPEDVYHDYVERILAVEADDVLEAARRHLDPAELSVVVVGDRARIEDDLRTLELGRVVAHPGPADDR